MCHDLGRRGDEDCSTAFASKDHLTGKRIGKAGLKQSVSGNIHDLEDSTVNDVL